MSEKRFTAKYVAELLGITTTNLKHYASLLEQNGLDLFRNTRNHREYSQKNIELLQAMQILNRQKSMLLEEAASLVMSSDTDTKTILNLKSTLIVAENNANIQALSQDSEDYLRNIVLALQYQLEKNDEIQVNYLTRIENKLKEQSEENIKLNLELKKIRDNLNEIQVNQKKSIWWKLFNKMEK